MHNFIEAAGCFLLALLGYSFIVATGGMDFIIAHPWYVVVTLLVLGAVFLAFVGALPDPEQPNFWKASGGCYGIFYRFCRGLVPMVQALESKRGVTIPMPQMPGSVVQQVSESSKTTTTVQP